MPPESRLQLELVAHLGRLTASSFASILFGVMVLMRDRRSGVAAMTLGWAVVNLAIVGASLAGEPPKDPEAFLQFLRFNLVLNFVWIGIGVVMARSRRNSWVAGAGRAMIVQGVALEALDLILYLRLIA